MFAMLLKFQSHSTPKGAPVCTMASKAYDWDLRNIAKISPNKLVRKFFRFSQKLHTIPTKLYTVILHHIRALYVLLWHQSCMTGI